MMPSISDSNMIFPIYSPSLHLSSLLWEMNTWWGKEEERLTNRQLILQKLLDKVSDRSCVKLHVMICISSQCRSRAEGGNSHIHISDERLLLCYLFVSFTGMVDPSNKPFLPLKILTLLGKALFRLHRLIFGILSAPNQMRMIMSTIKSRQ